MAESKPPIVVVYRKSERANKKYMTIIYNRHVDDVITKKRKPLIDNSFIIEDVGVGTFFIENYMKQHKLNKYNKIK
tara:strand:+ start:237 stop:464 length:228 start_codon:yes stop_codon:yes gene_type:complete